MLLVPLLMPVILMLLAMLLMLMMLIMLVPHVNVQSPRKTHLRGGSKYLPRKRIYVVEGPSPHAKDIYVGAHFPPRRTHVE